jgi:hypothetical protein
VGAGLWVHRGVGGHTWAESTAASEQGPVSQ